MSDFSSNFISALYDRNKARYSKRNRRNCVNKYKKHLKRLSGYGYMSGAYYATYYFDGTRRQRYKRDYRGQRSKHIKNCCNRKVRRTKGLYKGCAYKKLSEFWWEYD